MSPQQKPNIEQPDATKIHFESLEERLLLTTLIVQDPAKENFFVYENSKGEMVRIDITGNQGDSVELLSLWDIDGDGQNDVVDLVGLRSDNGIINPDFSIDLNTGIRTYEDPYCVINWPHEIGFADPFNPDFQAPPPEADGPAIPSGWDVITADENNIFSWVEFNATGSADEPATRGARTELFAIYVTKGSSATRLTLTTLSSADLQAAINTGFTEINPWTSATLPNLGYNGSFITAPAGSGGVIVGSEPFLIQTSAIDYIASFSTVTVGPDGVLSERFPNPGKLAGVAVDAGITIPEVKDPTTQTPLIDPDTGLPVIDPVTGEPVLDPNTGVNITQNFGRIIVGGTVSNQLTASGNIDVAMMGFLWGNVNVDKNLNALIMRRGGGGLSVGGFVGVPDNGSIITVGGVLGQIQVDFGGELFSQVDVKSSPDIAEPSNVIDELETHITVSGYSADWRDGKLVDLSNDIMQTAQFLSHPSGNFTLHGSFADTDFLITDPDNPTPLIGSGDWYALPLMAGQTVRIEGTDCLFDFYGPGDGFGSLTGLQPYLDTAYFGDTPLYNKDSVSPVLRFMATFGYETIAVDGDNILKPLVFTAPSAGVYYIHVINGTSDYELKFTNGTKASFGGINLIGNYYGHSTFGINSADFMVENGGTLGAVVIFGESHNTSLRTIGGGDIITLQAETFGGWVDSPGGTPIPEPNSVVSDGSIGRIAATLYYMALDNVEAGATDGYYNDNAHIQNLYAGTDFFWGLFTNNNSIRTSGSIGVIDVQRHIGSFMSGATEVIVGGDIRLNTDGVGPGGYLDLMNIVGNYQRIHLYHGLGGDIGYIHVGGTIYISNLASDQPQTVSDGSETILYDDGGGQLTIEAQPTRDQFGQPITPTTYSYTLIPVEDSDGGVGGVIANLKINGSITMSTYGLVQISNLDITGAGPTTEGKVAFANITINGPGTTNIYYLDGDQNVKLDDSDENLKSTDLVSFVNNTPGELISASLGSVQNMHIAGEIGQLDVGHTGAWLFGNDTAPIISTDITVTPNIYVNEPQYGWFRGKVNGVNFFGSATVGTLWVGGTLGDVRVWGTLGTVTVNADNRTDPGTWDDWDGVNGLVWSSSKIHYIDVGDGLASCGTAEIAKAAILCTGAINTVYIEGNRYERTPDPNADINETNKEPMVFGEIDGAIIGFADGTTTITNIYNTRDSNGNIISTRTEVITVPIAAVNNVIGNGSTLNAIVHATQLDEFQVMSGGSVLTATVGNINFYGVGSEITNSEIFGVIVQKVVTSADSNGINNTFIAGIGAGTNVDAIGLVIAGGPGMDNVVMEASAGDIGTITTAGSVADIKNSYFLVDNGEMGSISARNLINNEYHLPGKIGTVTAVQDIRNEMYLVGAIGTMKSGGNFNDNDITVASTIDSMTIGGAFDSIISLNGPTTAYLKSLIANGNIAGTITSAGRIGTIISRYGEITADISTVAGGWNNDIDLIQTARGYTGNLSSAGSLGKLISAASLGTSPLSGDVKTIDIMGNLGTLRVAGAGSNLYSNINVGRNITTIDVDGTLYSDITTNGDLGSLLVDGGLGGYLDNTRYGSVTVFGTLKTLRFNTGRDLAANVTVGSSIGSLSIRGNIYGNIESLFGSLGNITATGGSIQGNLTGRAIGNVSANGGSITGDITATDGNISSVRVTNGNLTGDVISQKGAIGSVSVTNGSVNDIINAFSTIGSITVTNGNMNANVNSGRNIGKLYVTNGTLTGNVNAETGITDLKAGVISGAKIRSGGKINKLTANYIGGSTISSAWDIENINVAGSVASSYILAGYDTGADKTIGGGDDNPLNGGNVHRGTMKMVKISGMLDSSVIAAGVGPGADGNFLTLDNNVEAAGTSSITKMTVTGGFGATPANSAVLADTFIDSTFAGSAAAAGVKVSYGQKNTIGPVTGVNFGGMGTSTYITPNGLTLTLTKGTANYDESTGRLVLVSTDGTSNLTIKYPDIAGIYGKTIYIESNDDCMLGNLTISNNVRVSDILIDGSVSNMQIGEIAANSTWILPDGLKTAKIVNPNNVDITADGFTSFTTGADMNGTITTTLGDAGTITVGNLGGTINVRGNLKTLTVNGNLTGNVDVTNGDLETIKIGGIMSGDVNVERGITKNATVGSTMSGKYRALDIGTLKVGGSLSGLVSSSQTLGTLTVGWDISGKVLAQTGMKSLTAGSVSNAVIASGGNLDTVKIGGSMTNSYIFAGFNPGDAGYNNLTEEIGNIAIDKFSTPLYDEQIDQAGVGAIKTVTIGGDMVKSTISAAVGPGKDGYVGTNDDNIRGSGTITSVTVTGIVPIPGNGTIRGDNIAGHSYGIFAASNTPKVTAKGQPFIQNGNAYVRELFSGAGELKVTNFRKTANTMVFQFNHPIDFSTISNSTIELIASNDLVFDTSDVNISQKYTTQFTYNPTNYSVTVRLVNKTWDSLAADGTYIEAVVYSPQVQDIRGNDLAENYVEIIITDLPDTFNEATTSVSALAVDGGTMNLKETFKDANDFDILAFSANAYNYFSANWTGNIDAAMALFYRDDQGTADTADDTFELVARHDYNDYTVDRNSNIFEAFELPATGEYYLVMTPFSQWPSWFNPQVTGAYQIDITVSSSDQMLVNEIEGLPVGKQIAYVSNFIGQHNNLLGADNPKQLVYLNFTGGTATQYSDGVSEYNETVSAFNMSVVDKSLAGQEATLINGGNGVVGIVDNIISIYRDTPLSNPLGQLTVGRVDGTNWNNYVNATSGLWFTTVDPTTIDNALDPTKDFTTIFIGSADDQGFAGLLGIASTVDLANMSKADNAIVFAQNFDFYSSVITASTDTGKLNAFSLAFANTTAHELGHTLGLNHQPTNFTNFLLIADDPDNNPATPDDSNYPNNPNKPAGVNNSGVALMAYADATSDVTYLAQLGTALITSNEFPIGWIDTNELMLYWLA